MEKRLIDDIRAAAPDGVISADRLAALVPIESMSADETAQLILDLERAGVSVEVDPALTTPDRRVGPRVIPPAHLDLGEDEPGAPDPSTPQSLRRLSPSPTPERQTASSRPAAALAVILVLLALAVVWYLMRRT